MLDTYMIPNSRFHSKFNVLIDAKLVHRRLTEIWALNDVIY